MISVWEIQNARRRFIVLVDVENITIALGRRQSEALLIALRNFLSLRLKKEKVDEKQLIAFFGLHPEKKKLYLKGLLKRLGFNVKVIRLRPPYYAEQIDHHVLSFLHRLARRRDDKVITNIIIVASDNDYANALAEMKKRSWINSIGRIIVLSRANSSKLRRWATEFWRITIKWTNQVIGVDQEDFKAISVNGYTAVFERLK